MRVLLLLVAASLTVTAFAGGPEEPQPEPKVLLRMIEALEKSGEKRLSSHAAEEGDGITYHLTSVEFLGRVIREKEVFLLANAFYIRSGRPDRDTPPARGHSFVVVFHPDFTIAAACNESVSGARLHGNKLMRKDELLADFDQRDIGRRRSGWMIDGGSLLPYFFADKIAGEKRVDEGDTKTDPEK